MCVCVCVCVVCVCVCVLGPPPRHASADVVVAARVVGELEGEAAPLPTLPPQRAAQVPAHREQHQRRQRAPAVVEHRHRVLSRHVIVHTPLVEDDLLQDHGAQREDGGDHGEANDELYLPDCVGGRLRGLVAEVADGDERPDDDDGHVDVDEVGVDVLVLVHGGADLEEPGRERPGLHAVEDRVAACVDGSEEPDEDREVDVPSPRLRTVLRRAENTHKHKKI